MVVVVVVVVIVVLVVIVGVLTVKTISAAHDGSAARATFLPPTAIFSLPEENSNLTEALAAPSHTGRYYDPFFFVRPFRIFERGTSL